MTEIDRLEIDLRIAERDLARDERDRLQRLVDEIKAALSSGDPAEEKVRWLINRLHF